MKTAFIVANIIRSSCDSHASILSEHNAISGYFCGTRKFTKNITETEQILLPKYGAVAYAAARLLPPYVAESVRFALCPTFEKEVIKQIKLGNHLLAGLGYLNRGIEKIHDSGGLAFLDARNSHPSSFWTIMAEEHARWDCMLPPIFPKHHARQQRSVALADYFFVPSNFVKDSFIKAGVPEEKLLYLPYPIDLSLFTPPKHARPPNRPLTLACSGGSSFRKGTPYLFEAFRIIRKHVPNARLKIVGKIPHQLNEVCRKSGYNRLPVEISSYMTHPELAKWLNDSDVYVLPTLEEGMVRSAAEAMACGLPVVTTKNSGINDAIQEGRNGSIVPIRDAQATADAVLSWWEKIQTGQYCAAETKVDQNSLGFENFRIRFLQHLKKVGIDLNA